MSRPRFFIVSVDSVVTRFDSRATARIFKAWHKARGACCWMRGVL